MTSFTCLQLFSLCRCLLVWLLLSLEKCNALILSIQRNYEMVSNCGSYDSTASGDGRLYFLNTTTEMNGAADRDWDAYIGRLHAKSSPGISRVFLLQISNPSEAKIEFHPDVTHIIFLDQAYWYNYLGMFLTMPLEWFEILMQTFAPGIYSKLSIINFTFIPSRFMRGLQAESTSSYDFITYVPLSHRHSDPLPLRDYYCRATRFRFYDQILKILKSIILIMVVVIFYTLRSTYRLRRRLKTLEAAVAVAREEFDMYHEQGLRTAQLPGPEQGGSDVDLLRNNIQDLLMSLQELKMECNIARIEILLSFERTLDDAALETCDTCIICLEDLVPGTQVPDLSHSCLNRSHFQHSECLRKWFNHTLKTNQDLRCPVCAAKIRISQ